MKKLLLFAFVVFVICSISFADMGAPSAVYYSAYISNPNGAPYFDENNNQIGTINFKDKIICDSYYDQGMYRFILDGESFSYEKGQIKFIDPTNITIDNLSKYKLNEKEKVRAFGNVNVYDIPFDDESHVIGTIPSETDIDVQGYIPEVDGGEEAWSSWYYTSYNGLNGWIKIENFAFKKEIKDSITDVNLLSEKGSFVPMYTPIVDYYSFSGFDYAKSVMYYNGEVVILNNEGDIGNKVKDSEKQNYTYVILFEGVPLYEQANLKSETVVENIPVGSKLVGNYVVWSHGPEIWIDTDYNGTRGWLYIKGLPKNQDEANLQMIQNAEQLKDAEENNYWNNKKHYTPINYPTTMDEYKNYYANRLTEHVKFEEDLVKNKKDNNIEDQKVEVTQTEEQTQPEVSTSNTEPETQTNNEIINNSSSNVPNVNNIQNENSERALIMVLTALVVFLTILVIILLVNRKRN